MGRIGIVTCLYDTGFEDLAAQCARRAAQLSAALDGLAPWTFLVCADGPERAAEACRRGLASELASGQARVLALPALAGADSKGRALREGFAALLADPQPWAAIGYVNLNLKVHLAQLLPALERLREADLVVGSRAPGEGGGVHGAGPAGRLKSIVYNLLAQALLPPLRGFRDTNAPLKLFRPSALRHLLEVAEVEDLSFDTEWMLAAAAGGFRIATSPLVWVQRPGSRPPWGAVGRVVASALRQRRRWRAGELNRR